LFSACSEISPLLNENWLYFCSLVICKKRLLQILLLLQQPHRISSEADLPPADLKRISLPI
ncbi:MAG: hypothetical protein IKJ65_13005, partial [Clostridia bacterium]|nr:hypothetical protein [Clostridia bacterium]